MKILSGKQRRLLEEQTMAPRPVLFVVGAPADVGPGGRTMEGNIFPWEGRGLAEQGAALA